MVYTRTQARMLLKQLGIKITSFTRHSYDYTGTACSVCGAASESKLVDTLTLFRVWVA